MGTRDSKRGTWFLIPGFEEMCLYFLIIFLFIYLAGFQEVYLLLNKYWPLKFGYSCWQFIEVKKSNSKVLIVSGLSVCVKRQVMNHRDWLTLTNPLVYCVSSGWFCRRPGNSASWYRSMEVSGISGAGES